MKDFFSHIKADKKEYLIEHLKNTADLASYFASSFGWSIVAEQAGLLHDLGKMRQIIESFYSDFDQSINTEIPDRYDGDGKNTMNRYIYENESVNDQDKIYLCGIRHTHGMKSELNRDKAAARYPEIYSSFAKDNTVEYVFSEDKSQECMLENAVRNICK